jgi:Uma2 family endonuclease
VQLVARIHETEGQAGPMGPSVTHATLTDMLDPRELYPEMPRLITREEFHRLGQSDFFADDERVELIRGVLVTPPLPHPRHDAIIHRLTRLLVLAVGKRGWVRVNTAYGADDYSEVLPDLAIVPDGDYDAECPTVAWLIVEVAISSLRKDRRVKAPLYAENGVSEYWIVNAEARTVEVHTAPRDGRYEVVSEVPATGAIRLVKLPDVEIPVAEMFGTAR